MSSAPLRIAIADYPHTLPLKEGRITSPTLKLDFVEVNPMNRAFKPMVRELAYDASELALVTYLQARAYGKDLLLLPAAMLGRFQHNCMLYNSDRGRLTPRDLAGKKIGVRAYSQTTAIWLRGILQNDYGVDFSAVQWVTFEDGHVAECADPPFVVRAQPGKDMTEMLQRGELDAAIYGAAMPDDPRLQSVIPDPDADARLWYHKHGVVPVNHMVVVKGELARSNRAAVDELYRLMAEAKQSVPVSGIDTTPFGIEANRPALELLIRYSVQQQVIPRQMTVDELFAVPPG